MKIHLFLLILPLLKAQASFLDNLRGAISNINNGIGKFVGDVVTDVKDTFYCTISAVEQVLVQNGLLDKRTLYNQKCKGTEKPKEQSLESRNSSTTVSTIREHSVIHHKHSSRRISHESEHSIKNVNKTIIDVSSNRNVEHFADTLKANAEHIAEITKILKQETENISKSFNDEIKKLQVDNNQTPIELILKHIEVLNDLQRNSRNDTEVKEIRRILDKVTEQINLKINNDHILDTHELKVLKQEFLKYSNNSGQFNSTIEKQSFQGISENLSTISEVSNTNSTKTFKDVAIKIFNKEDANKIRDKEYTINQDSQSIDKPLKPEKSIFDLSIDSLASFFKSMSVSSDDLKNVKNIVAHSEHSDKILKDFV